ncbi:MAG: BREX-1 system adenine-specific DNA-methyltransferase PglX [Syntrophomonadaceae bacterium]
MNKTAIKNFAIWARNKLIADITYKAGLLGITENEVKNPLPQSTKDVQFFDIGTKEPYAITGAEIVQRRKLAEAIQQKAKQSDYMTAYKSVIEEVAYTWFNRLIAVRFMEVNDYLPSRVRVLSSESSTKIEPDLVTSPFDADLEYTPYEKDRIMQLKSDNKLDELFRMLFIKQCNALNAFLPELFEKTNDYTELLMNVSFTDKDGVVYRLVNDIPEDDFNVAKEGQVEIIGWLYQYYNTEPKDETFALLKKNVKITKERIPAATQLFTPHWIVRYMVENSLGRLWIEGELARHSERSEQSIANEFGWKYYLEEAPQEPEVEAQLAKIREEYKDIKPEDIKVLDPCMGSGHILVYAFDVLMQIYESWGYSQRDAAKLILEKNLYGLEIDRRAYQLAYFALMMKARQYNRRILILEVRPQVYEPTGYEDGMEYGSLVIVDKLEPMPEPPKDQLKLFDESYDTKLNAWNFRRLLAQKYDVVVTNPPYMGGKGQNAKISEFLAEKYADVKFDTFSAFIVRCCEMAKPNGYVGMFTPYVWMFIERYSKLREYIYDFKNIISLIQFEYSAFEEATVPVCTFVIRNILTQASGEYLNLTEFRGGMEVQRMKTLEAVSNAKCGYRYTVNTNSFKKIPGAPISFTVSSSIYEIYNDTTTVADYGVTREGMATANNDLFLRFWFEVLFSKVGLGFKDRTTAQRSRKKWFPYNKGGDYRKWYGNDEYLVNWYNDGAEIMNYTDERTGRVRSHNYNLDYIFKEGVTWTALSSGNFGSRYSCEGKLADSKGSMLYLFDSRNTKYTIGFLNSAISVYLLRKIAQTLDFKPGRIAQLPLRIDSERHSMITIKVETLISLSKADWDAFETSWDFTRHPLICGERTIAESFAKWEQEAAERFDTLKANEEELNRIFIDIYGLQDELTPEVEDKDVTVRCADLEREIRSLISYAVGCMFGRYSLDVDGLAFAGGEWDDSKYSTFIPDMDNVLPITDEEYFEDDVVGLFCAFLKKTFGEETLEENLDFIAKALGNKGNSSREIIRNYFLKDFFKDHCKIYQKRPIYWLFDSGKADGFKALIYMHRYNEDTIGNLRIDYLHRMQRVYESEITRMQETIDNSSNGREVTAATKRKEKLIKQLKETKEYDEKIAHLALSRIAIDLDDGVKVNYEKVQTDTDGKKLEVLAKI